MPTTLERIEALEKTQADINQRATLILQVLGEIQSQSQQVMSTEQSVISLGKTLTAVIKVLIAKNAMTSAEVMDEIIKADAERDREELETVKATGQVVAAEIVDNECLVVCSQNYINVAEPDKCKTISDFVLVRMPMPQLSEQLRADFQGRKVGDTLTTSKKSDTEYYAFTVKEIYRINLERQGGEETCEGCDGHCSDCSTHNEPAMPNGPCDCECKKT